MKQSGLAISAIIAPLFFLLFSAPGALDFVFHYPDEKYYTDAVLLMMEKDDCFTPYQADGTPRFRKPILTYWVLMVSYNLFGVSRFSSRIFFWLAGAILVLITWRMAFSLTKNKQTALTAAFITASNPLVLISSGRSIPDILLVLFLTISAWGFLEIILSDHPPKKYYWMAWLGAALAFETKGVPAVAYAGVSLLFLLVNPWNRKKPGQLIEPWSAIVSVTVALGWFVIMYFEHGITYFTSFFNDQVGDRVSSTSVQVVKNTFLGIITLIAFMFPWILIIFFKPRPLFYHFRQSENSLKSVFVFIVLWILLTLVMSGSVFKFYDRYVLPVIPLFSALIAIVLQNNASRITNFFFRLFVVLNLIILLINILYALFILPDPVLIAGIVVALVFTGLWAAGVFRNISAPVLTASGILLLYFSGFTLLYPLLMPNPGEQLVQNLKKNGLHENQKVYVYGNIRAASNIRIHSENRFFVVSMDTVYTLPEEPQHFLVFDEREQERLDLKNYDVSEGSSEWLRVPVEKFPLILQKPVSTIKKNAVRYRIAKPKHSESGS